MTDQTFTYALAKSCVRCSAALRAAAIFYEYRNGARCRWLTMTVLIEAELFPAARDPAAPASAERAAAAIHVQRPLFIAPNVIH